jgi:hypothetical protein
VNMSAEVISGSADTEVRFPLQCGPKTLLVGVQPGIRRNLPSLGQLNHANWRLVAPRAAGPAPERRLQLPDRRVTRPASKNLRGRPSWPKRWPRSAVSMSISRARTDGSEANIASASSESSGPKKPDVSLIPHQLWARSRRPRSSAGPYSFPPTESSSRAR